MLERGRRRRERRKARQRVARPASYRGLVLGLAGVLVVVLGLVVFLASREPASPPAPPVKAYPYTINDSLGTSTTFTQAPQRVVSLSPDRTALLLALGVGDRLVAVDLASLLPGEAPALPRLDASALDLEALKALQPDMVFLGREHEGYLERLSALGIASFYLWEPLNTTALGAQVQVFGSIFNVPTRALELITDLQAQQKAVVDRVADVASGPRVYYEASPAPTGASEASWPGSLLATLKARNVVTEGGAIFPKVSLLAIRARDPEVILLASPPEQLSLETLKQRPGWDEITAVKTGRVYYVDRALVGQPTLRVKEALETLGRLLYPERFSASGASAPAGTPGAR